MFSFIIQLSRLVMNIGVSFIVSQSGALVRKNPTCIKTVGPIGVSMIAVPVPDIIL